jgi:hypothetical protein
MEASAEAAESGADQPADRCLPDQLCRFDPWAPARGGEDEEEEDEGERQAVVQARLEVQRVADYRPG